MEMDDITERNILTTRTRMRVLTALNAQAVKNSEAEMKDKQARLRSKTIEELITTEKSFLHQLQLVEKFFMQPLEERRLLSAKQFNIIFGKLEGIRVVNEELLSQLETNSKSVGKAFLELAPYLKMYYSYASSFEEANALIQKLVKDNREFASFLHNQETRPETATKLVSLLIAPIQRVPRYKLLLDELMQHTNSETEEFQHLKKAILEIAYVTHHINERIREHDNMQKMLTIQGSLVDGQPKIMIPGRQFIKEGPLMKVSRNGTTSHQRIFFLFNDMLMYCKQHGSDYGHPASLSCSCILPIKHCSVESLFECGRKNGSLIKLTCKEEALLMYTDNPEIGNSWVTAIQSAVRQYSESRQTLRKESSAKRPLRRAALLKQKMESLSQLQQKRKLEAMQQETTENIVKDSLYPMRQMCKAQDCLTTLKKTKMQLPHNIVDCTSSEKPQTGKDMLTEYSEEHQLPTIEEDLQNSLSEVGAESVKFSFSSESNAGSDSGSKTDSQGSSQESSLEVMRMKSSTKSLVNAQRFFAKSKLHTLKKCTIL